MNMSKTKTMTKRPGPASNISVGNYNVENVDKYIHLGYFISYGRHPLLLVEGNTKANTTGMDFSNLGYVFNSKTLQHQKINVPCPHEPRHDCSQRET